MQYNISMIKKVFTALAAALAAGLIFTSAVAAAPYSEENTPAEGTEQTEEAQSSSQVNSYARTYTGIFGTDAYLRIYLPIDISDEELAQATEQANALHEEIKALLTSLDSSMNIANENSYISQFNSAEAGSEIEIDYHTYQVLSIAIRMFEETDGYYNPGVYYSVDLYGFGVRADYNERRPYDRDDYRTQLPDNEYVTAFQQLGESFAEVSTYQRDGKYYVSKPEKTVTVEGRTYSLAMDLGGIGKGYAIDLVDGLIDGAGFEYGYFNFGSSSQAINESPSKDSDGMFKLSFQNPRKLLGAGYLTTRTANVAISTSGDYILSYTIDGTRYSHIINPKTGAPIRTGIATATVLDGRDGEGIYSAAESDARTTALCAMGVERATEYMNELTEKGIKVAFLHENGIGWLNFYTNMEEGTYTLNIQNELPSWVYLVICIGFVVVVVAAYAIVRVVKNRRAAKAAQAVGENSESAQIAVSKPVQSAENKAENAAVSGPSQAEGSQNTEKENKDGDL